MPLKQIIISTAQKMKSSIKDFFSKCDQIQSHLLKKSLMENFIFCAVKVLANLVFFFNFVPFKYVYG